jgi:hypothetical protein
LNKVDQTMMRRLRELADRRGWSVERLIRKALEQWLAQCQAERELETKIISEKTTLAMHSLGVLQSFTASQLLP